MVCNTNKCLNHTWINMKWNEIRVALSTTMPTSMVLNDIFLELLVGGSVLNVPKCFKICLNFIRISWWLHTGTNIIKEELQVQVHIILNNHVVKNHTSGHDVMEGMFVPKMTRTSNYCKSSCKTPKALSISFRAASCAFANSASAWFSILDGLHKCCPL
jgi:hypothetical protein